MTITIDHRGKVAFVTGAGAGIGREIARWLARAGAAVAIVDVRAAQAEAVVAEIVAEGGHATAVVANLRDDAEIERAVHDTVRTFGRLDIAVNNVGMIPPGRTTKPIADYTGDDWRDIVDQNLTLAGLCAGAEVRAMRATGAASSGGDRQGVILFVTSGETTRPSPHNAIYAASKAAINHLVTSLAVEVGREGIRVLAIAPGTTDTEQVRAVFDDGQLRAIAESTALGRAVTHDELGRLAVFLASDLARCITGQFIIADAGAFLSRSRPAFATANRPDPA